MPHRTLLAVATIASALLVSACADLPKSSDTAAGHAAHAHGSATDTRQLVKFPEEMRVGTLANMRDHLLALGQIQSALAAEKYAEAAEIAENRLGMSSLKLHGAHDVANFMPQGMQDTGTLMHRTASRFAIQAQNASATGDVKPALAELGQLTQACVACHAGYRLQ